MDSMTASEKDSLAAFEKWYDCATLDPPVQPFVEALTNLVNDDKKSLQTIVEAMCKYVPKVLKSSKSRSDFSLAMCKILDERPKALAALWEEANRRTTLIWSVPDDQLFFFILMCDLYVKDEKASFRNEVSLCIAVERIYGKTRPAEAASRFHHVLKAPSTAWDKFEKATLTRFPLSSKSRALRVICSYAAETGTSPGQLITAYVDAVFTSKGHLEEDVKTTTWAMTPLLKTLRTEDVATYLSGPVGRALRLTTEKSLPAAILLCDALDCNVIPEDCMLTPGLKALRTSSKENVQEMSARLVSSCLSRASEAACGGVLKELCDEIPREGSLYRRGKMIKALSSSSPQATLVWSKLVFTTLVRRGKDEKVDEMRSLCFESSANWVSPNLINETVDAEVETVLSSVCPQNLAGVQLIRTVATHMQVSQPTRDALIKQMEKVASATDAEARTKLYASDALVALGHKSLAPKLDLVTMVDQQVEADCLAAARILSKFSPNEHGAPGNYYLALGRLLANTKFPAVRQDALTVCRNRVVNEHLEKDMMRTICGVSRDDDAVMMTRFAIEAMLPSQVDQTDAEHLALTLVLSFRCATKDRKSIWASLLKHKLSHDARRDSFRHAAPFLFAPERDIDADALSEALHIDPSVSILESFLLERLRPEAIKEVSTEEMVAAYSAPPGRLSDYRSRTIDQQTFSDDEDDSEDAKVRLLRQGRKGRGGARKELYSAENEEWERKIRAEQKEKAKQQQPQTAQKELSPAEIKALQAEESMRNTVKHRVHVFADATHALIVLARNVPQVCQGMSDKILPLALSLSRSVLVGTYANSILETYLSLVFSHDSRLTSEVKTQLRKTKDASPIVLVQLNDICRESMLPLAKDLFELVFPVMLKFASRKERQSEEENGESSFVLDPLAESKDEITDAMFNLLALHHNLVTRPKREQILPGLLHVVSQTPLPSSLDCVVSLFSEETPSDSEIAVLVGDDGLLHDESAVRLTALTALKTAQTSSTLETYFWFASSDVSEKNRSLAEVLASKQPLPEKYYETLSKLLASKKEHVRLQAARAISAGIDEHPDKAAEILGFVLSVYNTSLAELKAASSSDKSQIKFFERNSSNSRKDTEPDSTWYTRSGVSFTLSAFAGLQSPDKEEEADSGLAALGPVFEPKEALVAIEFVLAEGTRDPFPTVRAQMLSAGTSLLQAYGPDLGESLIALVQSYVEKKTGQAKLTDSELSLQQEGAVILLGAAASNLSADDARVPGIAAKLVSALETPSETVQRASVRILPQLMKSAKFKAENGGDGGRELVELCLGKALSSSSSASSRKGHAMGLAGLVKGLGISSLKTFSIIPRLTESSASDKWEIRQGSLFCFQELTDSLGRMFEPYVVQIVEPVLLKSFSDEKVDVRDAAHDASKNVMANLSGPGVSMLLPKLLSGIANIEWRTKQAAILMLGSVAFCAPKQLSSSLPQVVPKLIDAFTDTHPKVRAAAVSALKDVQSVVKNPEIEKISFALISALTDPHERTKDAVDVLFHTRFVHAVDAPSLALLVPILRRGLKERSTETKKKAALIVGNMISMISDAKAVKPYLEDLLPVLKVVLVDPIPGVRGTAAKALGTLVRGLGPEGIPDFPMLFQFLIDTMLTGMSSVERQGGAQGFVEVLVSLDDQEALDTGLNKEVFERATNPHSTPLAREGALWALVFLPTALEAVNAYAERALNSALNALADDVESVRDAALRCSRVYVAQFTLSEPNIVLAALENGMAHLNWRVKQTSVRLLGDFVASLQKAHWTGGAAQTVMMAPPPPELGGDDEDEGSDFEEEEEEEEEEPQPRGPGSAAATAAAAAAQEATFSEGPADAVLLKLFGAERRDAVIATVYLLRSDSSSQVRQNALFVWKSIVSNTPRTMKRIVKALMQNVVQLLSSTDAERQKVGGKALADIVRKLGDRVLPEIIPVVLRGLDKSNEAERIGVAMGLFELVGATNKTHLEPQAESVLQAVLKGLCDENSRVRDLAGKTFNRVHVLLGAQVDGPATTFVLSRLCADIATDEERCTRGLTQAVEARSRDCLAFLLPRLLARPIQPANVRALASCMSVVPSHLHHYLRQITRALVQELAATSMGPPEDTDSELWLATVECFAGSVSEEQAVSTLLVELADLAQTSTEASYRRASMAILAAFLSNTEDVLESDLGAAVALKSTIRQFAESDPLALSQSAAAFSALVKHVGASNMTSHVDFIRNSVRTVASMDKHRPGLEKKQEYELPAFSLKVTVDALLEVYQYALMNGTNEERESAAEGLGELVDLTYSDTLKPYVVKITGPLIRIVGDRFPSPVKSAILDTLRKLLIKGGVVLRPFLPQLQTTFVKALQNSAETVRMCGFRALQVLVPLSPRVDPLCSELVQGCTSTDPEIRLNMVKAILFVLSNRLADVSLAGLTKILEKTSPVDACVNDWQDPAVRVVAAAVEGKALEGLLQIASEESQALQDAVAERFRARLKACVTDEDADENAQARHGALLSLDAALRVASGAAFVAKCGIDPLEMVQLAARDETSHVRAVACDTAGWALLARSSFGGSSSSFTTMLQQAAKNDAVSMVRGVAEVSLNRTSEMYTGALEKMEAELV